MSFTRPYSFLPSFLPSVRSSVRSFVCSFLQLLFRSSRWGMVVSKTNTDRSTMCPCAQRLENETPIRMEMKHLNDSKMKHSATSATIISNLVFPLKCLVNRFQCQKYVSHHGCESILIMGHEKDKPTAGVPVLYCYCCFD